LNAAEADLHDSLPLCRRAAAREQQDELRIPGTLMKINHLTAAQYTDGLTMVVPLELGDCISSLGNRGFCNCADIALHRFAVAAIAVRAKKCAGICPKFRVRD
jgi:hypothetical protein